MKQSSVAFTGQELLGFFIYFDNKIRCKNNAVEKHKNNQNL